MRAQSAFDAKTVRSNISLAWSRVTMPRRSSWMFNWNFFGRRSALGRLYAFTKATESAICAQSEQRRWRAAVLLLLAPCIASRQGRPIATLISFTLAWRPLYCKLTAPSSPRVLRIYRTPRLETAMLPPSVLVQTTFLLVRSIARVVYREPTKMRLSVTSSSSK